MVGLLLAVVWRLMVVQTLLLLVWWVPVVCAKVQYGVPEPDCGALPGRLLASRRTGPISRGPRL